MIYFYDIEIFPNCFMVTFIPIQSELKQNISINKYINADINNEEGNKKIALDLIKPKIFIIYNETNQLIALTNFLKNKNTEILIGYNNIRYDNIILDYLLYSYRLPNKNSNEICDTLYKLSSEVINYQGNYRKDNGIPYSKQYKTIDLMKLHYLDVKKISLKQVSIALKWYKIEDYSMPSITKQESIDFYDNTYPNINSFNRYVIDSHLSGILNYNINDVLITISLYYQGISELKQRVNATSIYNLNCLSDSRSSLADKIIRKLYEEATGLNYFAYCKNKTYHKYIYFNNIIANNISFKTKKLSIFLNNLKDKRIHVGVNTFSELLIFRGTAYTFKTGGLHSVDRGKMFNNDKYNIIDADVSSYYPSIMIILNIYPKHIFPIFIKLLKNLTNERLKAKKEKNKSTADILKIVINSLYGKMGAEYSWLFDLEAMYKVTINGQLYLMMLIEELELNNIHVISANTDGIVSLIKDEQLNMYYKICHNWEEKTKFGVEFTKYKKYVRTTVNDYITLKEDGTSKSKGDFVSDIRIDKGYYAPAIAKTLQKYYIEDNHNIDKIIKSFNIYDYCISIKVGSQFKTELHSLKNSKKYVKILPKNNRYFISNTGGIILKHNIELNTYTNIIKKRYVTIFNKYYKSDDYNINYNWYKSKVMDIINKINCINTKDMKKQCGTLFDNL